MNNMHHMGSSSVLWSEVKDQILEAGDGLVDAVIPYDMIVIVDEDMGPLGTLAIHGKLKASNDVDVTLTAENVLVFGALEVGTEDAPHTRDFEIVLTGDASAPDIVLSDWVESHGHHHMDGAAHGHSHMDGQHDHHMTAPIDNKALIVAPGGKIDLHGAEATSWTQLNGTVEAGATEIDVLDAAGWKVGDTITIAPTGLDAFEVEDRVITSIDGNTISFDAPLEHQHYGAQQDVGDGRMVDMRAEVANLSRNITIRGEEDPDLRMAETNSSHDETAFGRVGYGGHVMVLNDTEVRIDGAEFTELGITGEIGRYPLHFHHSGDMSGSYVQDIAVHHTLQRGIVVHQTDNLLVKDSVVYDVMSHGIYIEDGVETGNRFEGNFVMLPRTTPNEVRIDEPEIRLPVREAGEKASGFWITNVENEFEGNHVAAIPTGQGFWFVQPDVDTSHVARNDPRGRDNTLLQFEDNAVHTVMNDDAIGFLMGYSPIWTGVALDIQLPVGEDAAPIKDFTAWQVANMAIASIATNVDIINPMAADVRKFVHVALDDEESTLVENAVFVVKSDNMPDDVDVREYFQNRTNEGPHLSHAGTELTFKGLNIVGEEHLHSAGDRVEDLVRLTFIAGDDGRGVYTIEDLAQDYRREVPEELERGDAFFAFAGNDEVRGGDRDDAIVGGDGNDRLGGHGGADILVGGAGNDELSRAVGPGVFRSKDDLYLGGVGDDVIDLGGKTSDERNNILFREGDGNDLVLGFDSEGTVHDTITLVGYEEADLDADGDGDFDDADLAQIRTDVEVDRFNKNVVLDLGGGDSIAVRLAKHKDELDAGDFAFIPEPDQADARVVYALSLDALPGALDSSAVAPEPPVEEPVEPEPVEPEPVEPDPVEPEPIDPGPVIPDPDPIDPDPVDPMPVDPDPVDPDPVDPDPVEPTPVGQLALIDGPVVLGRGEAVIVDHVDAFAAAEGSLSLAFRPDNSGGTQTLFSKDSSGFDDGGHLGISIRNGEIAVRAQTDAASLTLRGGQVSTTELNDLTLSWADDALTVALNGDEIGVIEGWTGGLSANLEPIVLGASQARSGDGAADRLYEFFEGEIVVASFSGSAATYPDPAYPPADYTPVDPAPTDPAPTDPAPVDPAPVDPPVDSGAGDPFAPVFALDDAAVSKGDGVISVSHDSALALSDGTLAFSFTSALESHREGLVSKDARSNGDGGHLSVYVEKDGDLVARIQAENGQTLLTAEDAVTAGEEHDLAFSFGEKGAMLFLDGELVAADENFTEGLEANEEYLQLGALGWKSGAGQDGFVSELEGTVTDFRVYDEQLGVDYDNSLFV